MTEKLLRFVFNEIIVTSYSELLNQHSLLTILSKTYLCGEVLGSIFDDAIVYVCVLLYISINVITFK